MSKGNGAAAAVDRVEGDRAGELGPRLQGGITRRGVVAIVAVEGPAAAHDALPGKDTEDGQQLDLHPALAVDSAKPS